MLLHPLLLLLGGALVAVPVIIHLAMRRQPRQLEFPALMLVKPRRQENRRRLQLRHWVLLALRGAAILLAAAALARPSVASGMLTPWLVVGGLGGLVLLATGLAVAAAVRGAGRTAVIGLGGLAGLLACLWLAITGWSLAAGGGGPILADEEEPVAAVLVFDTSPRMGYTRRNETTLDRAAQIARELLQEFPGGSEVAVVGGGGWPALSTDLAAARKGIEELRPGQTVGGSLADPLLQAVELLTESELPRRALYIFTDGTRPAWSDSTAGALRSRLAEQEAIAVQVVDLGEKKPENVSLDNLELTGQMRAGGSEFRVATSIRSRGLTASRVVQLWLEEPDASLPRIVDGRPQLPQLTPRSAAREVNLTPGDAAEISFDLPPLAPGVHQGQVRVSGADPLAVDDVRYFTLEVSEVWRVAVIAPPEVNTEYLEEALAPYELRSTGQAWFACERLAPAELGTRELAEFDAIALVDPPPLPERSWKRLAAFLEAGGGLAVLLGPRALPPEEFNSEAALAVLPGAAVRQRRGEQMYLSPAALTHPVLRPFSGIETTVPWNLFPVSRHWSLEKLDPAATVLVPFGHGEPALVERQLGAGRVLLFTTPISHDAGRPWNRLTAPGSWPTVVLLHEAMRYLAVPADTRLNYLAGETATLPNESAALPDRYQLFPPREEPYEVRAAEGMVAVPHTTWPGAYRLKGQKSVLVSRGFAVNVHDTASDLTPAEDSQFDAVLGAGRYQRAADRQAMQRAVDEARRGRELFPFLCAALVIVLALESLLSNRFYRPAPVNPT